MKYVFFESKRWLVIPTFLNIRKIDNDENEADRVLKKVAEIKSRAYRLGVPELINELYHNNIRYYPTWIQRSPRDYVPSIVKSAVELEVGIQKNKNLKRIKINIQDKEYIFDFEEYPFAIEGEDFYYGNLEIFFNNKKILALRMSQNFDKNGSAWRAFEIDAFIEGDWIEDFKELQRAIRLQETEIEIKKMADPENIKKLKRDFGIK